MQGYKFEESFLGSIKLFVREHLFEKGPRRSEFMRNLQRDLMLFPVDVIVIRASVFPSLAATDFAFIATEELATTVVQCVPLVLLGRAVEEYLLTSRFVTKFLFGEQVMVESLLGPNPQDPAQWARLDVKHCLCAAARSGMDRWVVLLALSPILQRAASSSSSSLSAPLLHQVVNNIPWWHYAAMVPAVVVTREITRVVVPKVVNFAETKLGVRRLVRYFVDAPSKDSGASVLELYSKRARKISKFANLLAAPFGNVVLVLCSGIRRRLMADPEAYSWSFIAAGTALVHEALYGTKDARLGFLAATGLSTLRAMIAIALV